jgi:predicted ATP-grasp superfamily ATP-dependent carboligase
MKIDSSHPVIILGGLANSLSLARSFGRHDIHVTAVLEESAFVFASRYCKRPIPVPLGADIDDFYHQLLISDAQPEFTDSVLLSCSDDAVRFVAENHSLLQKNYLLERHDPGLQINLLNKEKTLELARGAGVPTPLYTSVKTIDDMARLGKDISYPVMLKPHNTFLFYRLFRRKYRLARNENELLESATLMYQNKITFMLCEMIPGPDSLNYSYYTYRGEQDQELLSLTKRCLRRLPINEGAGTYQITDEIPEVAELGKRFFDHLGYRGLGNIEFKRDPRDGVLKVMECNNRFTAVQEQLVRCGADAGLLAYRDLTGQQPMRIRSFQPGVAIWSPISDAKAFKQERQRSPMLTWRDWWRSMNHRTLVFPVFSWRDPAPFLMALGQQLNRVIGRVTAFGKTQMCRE